MIKYTDVHMCTVLYAHNIVLREKCRSLPYKSKGHRTHACVHMVKLKRVAKKIKSDTKPAQKQQTSPLNPMYTYHCSYYVQRIHIHTTCMDIHLYSEVHWLLYFDYIEVHCTHSFIVYMGRSVRWPVSFVLRFTEEIKLTHIYYSFGENVRGLPSLWRN